MSKAVKRCFLIFFTARKGGTYQFGEICVGVKGAPFPSRQVVMERIKQRIDSSYDTQDIHIESIFRFQNQAETDAWFAPAPDEQSEVE